MCEIPLINNNSDVNTKEGDEPGEDHDEDENNMQQVSKNTGLTPTINTKGRKARHKTDSSKSCHEW